MQVSTHVESFEDLSLPIPKSRVFDALAEQQLSLIASMSPPPAARSSLPSSKHAHHKQHTSHAHHQRQPQHSSPPSATATASSPSAHASNDGDGEPSPLSSCSTHASADSTCLNGAHNMQQISCFTTQTNQTYGVHCVHRRKIMKQLILYTSSPHIIRICLTFN